jgi:hypothetical protein
VRTSDDSRVHKFLIEATMKIADIFEGSIIQIFWVSLLAGLAGLLLGRIFKIFNDIFRTTKMLADMPKAPGKVNLDLIV